MPMILYTQNNLNSLNLDFKHQSSITNILLLVKLYDDDIE